MELYVAGSGSSGNCYVIKGGGSSLVIECGISPDNVFGTFDTGIVEGVLVSHEHGDHSGFVRSWMKMGIGIWSTIGTAKAMGISDSPLSGKLHYRGSKSIGKFSVTPFRTYHDAEEPCGFFIHRPELGNLVFATDTHKIDVKFLEKYAPEHIMIEANYDDDILYGRVGRGEADAFQAARVERSHLSIAQACEFVEKNLWEGLQTVTLIHLSSVNSDRKSFIERMRKSARFASVDVAIPGHTISLDDPFDGLL